VLTYLPGIVPSYPMPSWVWADQVLVDAGRRLAQFHQASASFDVTHAIWQLPAHQPAEVICLNDVAPYNMVFDQAHQLAGLIDVDTASPGPRLWDLAYLAYRLAPLSMADDIGAGSLSLDTRRHRLRRLCEAYTDAGDKIQVHAGSVLRTSIERLHDLAAFTAQRAADGADHVAHHVQLYLDDATWIGHNLSDISPG
jgi:Ser/Thr protein kinase RdoA (MazF antagonist)